MSRIIRRLIGTEELKADLSACVIREIATARAATEARLDRLVTEETSRLETSIVQEAYRNASHLDEHWSRQLAEQAVSLTTRLEASLHSYMNHLDNHLSEQAADLNTRLDASLHRYMSHLDNHLSQCIAKEVSLHFTNILPARTQTTDPTLIQRRLLTLGRLLEPVSAIGVAKLRVGRVGDGGYIMLDDFDRAHFALSMGVGSEMSWDIGLADRGIEVHQFDHTVERPPITHLRIQFHRSRIVPVPAGNDYSLASAQSLGGQQACIVKIDIEGDEWESLDLVPQGGFDQILQLICEFHDFDRVGDTAWFERASRVLRALADTFGVVHVHANNHGQLQTLGNVAFPEILEITFANRRFYTFSPSTEVFPTEIDSPNRHDLPDIILGSFRF